MAEQLQPPAPLAHGARRAALWLGLAIAISFAAVPFQTHEPFADGAFYVSTLHSLYVDRDVDLSDEAALLPWLHLYSLDAALPPGGLRNPFSIGPPLLWSPFYALYDLASRALGAPGITEQTGPRTAPVCFATTFWVVVGLGLLSASLGRLGAEPRERGVVTAAVFAASPLPAYVSYAPDMSHGCAFAASSLLLFLCVALRRDATPDSPRWLLCGLSLGLVFLARWQDVLLGAIPLTLLALSSEPDGDRTPLARRFRGAAWLAAGAALAALPQLLYWKALYGSWLMMPGEAEHLGSGGGFLSFANADPVAFFFSTWNGAFLCHPILALGLAGLMLRGAAARSAFAATPDLRAAILLGVGLHIVSSIVVQDWWAGGSFGQRRFVSLLPLLAVGLLAAWRGARAAHPRIQAGLAGTLALLVLWNGLSLYRLHEGSLPYNPADPLWYREKAAYGHYDYGRRLRDTLLGS